MTYFEPQRLSWCRNWNPLFGSPTKFNTIENHNNPLRQRLWKIKEIIQDYLSHHRGLKPPMGKP